MRIATYETIRSLIRDDPLTERQRHELLGRDGDEVVDAQEAARLLGISVTTLRRRKHELRPLKTTRYLRYRLADVLTYRDKQ